MFSYLTLAQRIPSDHPARQIRALVDRALARMDAELEKLYSDTGRPSIAPERLLRATLLMILFSIRSERQLMEQMNYNLLFRWFAGLEMDDAVWDVTVFTKNRERLIAGAVSQQLLESVLLEARMHNLLSEEHFTVDGTLIQAWAAARSFKEKSDPPAPGAGSGHKGTVLLRDKVESKRLPTGGGRRTSGEPYTHAPRTHRQRRPHELVPGRQVWHVHPLGSVLGGRCRSLLAHPCAQRRNH